MSSPESRADLTLAAAVRLLAPLVPLLLREGVSYPRFANALKKAFLEEAPAVLLDSSIRVNDSSVSTLTGIHRKDVREWRSAGRPRPQVKALGAAMTLFTRWSTDPGLLRCRGTPAGAGAQGRARNVRSPGRFGVERRAPAHRAAGAGAPGRCRTRRGKDRRRRRSGAPLRGRFRPQGWHARDAATAVRQRGRPPRRRRPERDSAARLRCWSKASSPTSCGRNRSSR